MGAKSMIRKLLRNKDKKIRQEKESSSWPTALERVAAARMAQSNGSIVTPTRVRPQISKLVFCPIVGKELLKKHEDCRMTEGEEDDDDDDDEDDDDEEDEYEYEYESDEEEEKEIISKISSTSNILLHKPVKLNRLLAHALTNANGTTWRRQRPFVQRALGDAAVTKKIAVPAAVKAAMELLLSSSHECQNQLEVRSVSLKIATSIMIASVFGDTIDDPKMKIRFEKTIQDLFHPTLLPVRGDAQKAVALDEPVREVVETIATTTTTEDKQSYSPCLARNLLEQERKATPERPTLSRAEVIGNCHSALLAGTQTIAITLTGAMLHLAEPQQEITEPNDEALFRAVINETLRILPPVATLPRCPVNGNLPIPCPDGNTEMLPRGGALLLDVLSIAHCSATTVANDDNPTTNPIENRKTFQFRPLTGANSKKKTTCYPWGFGDRICPAGNLSVSCITAVLKTLVIQEGRTWQFVDPKANSVGPTGTCGWIETVSYQPTLTYPNPLWLTLSRRKETSL